jgi:hypothetical protein
VVDLDVDRGGAQGVLRRIRIALVLGHREFTPNPLF